MGIRPSITPIYEKDENDNKVFKGYKECGSTYSQTKTGKKPRLGTDKKAEEKHITFKESKMKSGLERQKSKSKKKD